MKSEPTKKPYEAPKLSVYGDIREITQAVGSTSDKNDNAPSTGKTKTS